MEGDRVAGDRAGRGYVIACPRTWRRIRIEYTAGASAAWLSARYGPAERTLAARAKREGWRKTDVARLRGEAMAAEDAAQAEVARLTAEARARRGADVAAAGPGGKRDDGRNEDGGIDLVAARRLAQAKAVSALETGDARAAQDYLKLAQMLDGVGASDGASDGGEVPSPQDAAALAYVLERLGEEA